MPFQPDPSLWLDSHPQSCCEHCTPRRGTTSEDGAFGFSKAHARTCQQPAPSAPGTNMANQVAGWAKDLLRIA